MVHTEKVLASGKPVCFIQQKCRLGAIPGTGGGRRQKFICEMKDRHILPVPYESGRSGGSPGQKASIFLLH